MASRLTRVIKANWPSEVLHLTTMFTINSTIVFIFGDSLLIIRLLFPIACAFALGKELYDKYYKKTVFSISDIVATLTGGWAVPFLILAVDGIKTEWLHII
jgi:hypothetical protein